MNEDHESKTDVTEELAYESSLSADHIGVTAENGIVTLTCHVEKRLGHRSTIVLNGA